MPLSFLTVNNHTYTAAPQRWRQSLKPLAPYYQIYIEEPITSPGDTVGAPPDAGGKHQQHPGDAKQPIQAGPLGNTLHAPYK